MKRKNWINQTTIATLHTRYINGVKLKVLADETGYPSRLIYNMFKRAKLPIMSRLTLKKYPQTFKLLVEMEEEKSCKKKLSFDDELDRWLGMWRQRHDP